MIEVHLLIPLADNDAREFMETHHSQFESVLIDLFGGMSLLPGSVVGRWAQGDQEYLDRSRVYAISVGGLLSDGEKLRTAIELAKTHYNQLAIYVRYLGQSEIL